VEVVGEFHYDLGEPELAEVAGHMAEDSKLASTDLWAASKVVVSVQIQAIKPVEAARPASAACCSKD